VIAAVVFASDQVSHGGYGELMKGIDRGARGAPLRAVGAFGWRAPQQVPGGR
jgi:hypothetical protein